ncbi:MAG: amidase [Acidobacteria bacterium]|nr:amidase [Acidobacteriota bacterium]
MNLADVAALIRSQQVSPVEVTAAALECITQLNPRLNAFLTVTAESAQEQARAAENEIQRGQYRGPLHGVPVALKDLIHMRGVRTTAGSKLLSDFVPDLDAAVVEKLRRAGAVLVGKTALHEFAYGITNDNPHFGPTRNPWDPERTPGGSSGGSSVAVATGMAFAALGTDTGGSIRIPSSFCGVVGLKPTFGRVSLRGVYPLGYTLDHVGPLARSVVDAGIVYQTIAGFDSVDPSSVDQPIPEIRLSKALKGDSTPGRNREGAVTIGVPKDYFFNRLQPDVEQAVRAALPVFAELGARVVPVDFPEAADLTDASRLTLLVEALVVHREHLEHSAESFGPEVRSLLERGREVSATDYVQAQLVRSRTRRQLEQLYQQADVLVIPTTSLTAFPFGVTKVMLGEKEEDARTAATRLLRGFNATGHPALSIPCGFDSNGLPIGLQIIGRLWDEATVLQVGYAYEQATEWHKRRPPVP